jgi:hypothetical protein
MNVYRDIAAGRDPAGYAVNAANAVNPTPLERLK